MKVHAILALLGISSSVVAAEAPSPKPPAMLSSIRNDDYPKEAIVRHESGTSQVQIDIDAEDKLIRCQPTGKSGSPILDATSCRLIRKHATFSPARDSNGVAIPSEMPLNINWVMPGGAYPSRRPVDVVITLKRMPLGVRTRFVRVLQLQRADGSFESCSLFGSTGLSALDDTVCPIVTTPIPPLKGADDQPVRSLRIRQVAFALDSGEAK